MAKHYVVFETLLVFEQDRPAYRAELAAPAKAVGNPGMYGPKPLAPYNFEDCVITFFKMGESEDHGGRVWKQIEESRKYSVPSSPQTNAEAHAKGKGGALFNEFLETQPAR